MKKIISALLILTMVFSMVCVSTSAAGLFLDQNMNDMTALTANFLTGEFYIDTASNLLYGYSEARALQSTWENDDSGILMPVLNTWMTYDSVVNIAIADDDMNSGERAIALVYCNDSLVTAGRAENRVYMTFAYDVEEQTFLFGTDINLNSESTDVFLMEPVPYEIDTDGTSFFNLGMSVDRGRIRCFYNDELIFDFNDTADEQLIAKEITSPFILWNTGNFVQITNIKIAEAGYLFPYADDTEATTAAEPTPTETTTQGGDDPVPTETTTQGGDDPAPTGTTTGKVEDPANSNDDPANTNKAPDNSNAPANTNNNAGNNAPADTNTNKPAGGSSTATGDASFVVVAAMVAVLGCALVVKKAGVK